MTKRGDALPRAVVARLARARTLVVFDFDGTLAPITLDPDDAALRSSTRVLLRDAARLYPVAIVSGRNRRDITARVRGLGVRWVVGGHGAEPSRVATRCAREALTIAEELARQLPRGGPIRLEAKRTSATLHFRGSPDMPRVRARAMALAGSVSVPVRIVPGKASVNVVPACAPDKGQAVAQLGARARATYVLFIGDDVTDEDAFALPTSARVVGIKVGLRGRSRARYRLARQRDVDSLLADLIRFRQSARPK